MRLARAVRPLETSRLTPEQEIAFREWTKKHGVTDADHPESFYDYRGAFLTDLKSAINSTDGLPHWPDTFKQHGHPSFSVESKYSAGPGDGGTWGGPDGKTFSAPVRADSIETVRRMRQVLLRRKPAP